MQSNYWDVQTSNRSGACGDYQDWFAYYEANPDGLPGPCHWGNSDRTTAEMKQQSTFTDWDFINVWNIGQNQTYPYLRKYSAADINKDKAVNLIDLTILAGQWMKEWTPQ